VGERRATESGMQASGGKRREGGTGTGEKEERVRIEEG